MEQHCANHSILWCEERRKLEEQKIAQECVIQAQLIKQKNQLNKMREMQEVIKKQKFLTDNLSTLFRLNLNLIFINISYNPWPAFLAFAFRFFTFIHSFALNIIKFSLKVDESRGSHCTLLRAFNRFNKFNVSFRISSTGAIKYVKHKASLIHLKNYLRKRRLDQVSKC